MKFKEFLNGGLDRFYDRSLRTWIITLKDKAGNQVGDAKYAPTRKEAFELTLKDFEDAK